MLYKNVRGFTIIELIVTIAVIGVLVTIVLVMLDPVQRISDSRDRQTAGNVRAVGAAISACLTSELRYGTSGFPYGPKSSGFTDPHVIPDSSDSLERGCGNFTWMSASGRGYSSPTRPTPPELIIWNNGSANPNRVCLWAQILNSGEYWVYSTSKPEARKVSTEPTNCSADFDDLL